MQARSLHCTAVCQSGLPSPSPAWSGEAAVCWDDGHCSHLRLSPRSCGTERNFEAKVTA